MKKISVSSQKGGVGKSIITMILANRLAFQKGYKVLIIDCDIPQISILSSLKTEKKIFEIVRNKKLKQDELTPFEKEWTKEFERNISTSRPQLDIISFDDARIGRDFKKIEHYRTDYDFILYDLPGTLKDAKLLQEMLLFDYVFIPMEPNTASASKSISTAAGLLMLKEKFLNTDLVKLEDVYLFFNKVNCCSKQHRNEMSQLYTTAAKRGFVFLTREDGIPLYVDSKVLYQNTLCTSLLFDTVWMLRYTKMEATIQSMIKIITNGR